MTVPSTAPLRPVDLLHAARTRVRLWLIPAALGAVLAGGYALLRAPTWEATQALVVRDETSGSVPRPGKFSHADDMKTVQETILELAKSRDVLRRALVNAGPPEGISAAGWPSDHDVEALYDELRIVPPKGAEFGKTEMFYVAVRAASRPRAVTLAAVVSRELQASYEELRAAKAVGVVSELEKTVHLAEADLDHSTEALAAVESQVGVDLGDLRLLTELSGGDNGLRKMLGEIEAELRTQRANLSASQELQTLLGAAQSDPGRLLASPGKLLESQPALKRLKEGLIDAQLRTAQLQGSMSDAHPLVLASQAAEEQVASHLHGELANALRGIEVEIKMSADRIVQLETQRQSVEGRMQKLTGVRAQYANLAAAVKHRTDILKTAQSELSEARANRAAAKTASLITLVGGPETGSRPAGPGTTAVGLLGALGGLAFGLGLVTFTATPVVRQSRAPADEREPLAPAAPDLADTVWRTPTEQSLRQALRKLAHGSAGGQS